MTTDNHIFIKNIYYMLAYAFTTLRQDGYESVAGEEFRHLHDLFAAILAKGIGRQLKQGLHREYVSRTESLSVMRGKIDLPGTIRHRLANRQMLSCEYDELSVNNLLNQILKTAAVLLLQHGEVDAARKNELKKTMLFFSQVDTIEPSMIRWQTLRFHRNNSTYRMLISLCQLLLEGMLMTTEAGDYRLASFLDEQQMSRLYEKFLLSYFDRECPQVKASADQIAWQLDDGVGAYLPAMQSDITLTSGKRVLIIDAKYYSRIMMTHYQAQTLHSANLYQIFTYVKNKASAFPENDHEVSGMLLYAGTDETVQPNNAYRMSGNQISVQTLDLNRPFSEIAAQLNRTVTDHFPDAV